MKIISWNCNGIKHNWNTILSLLQTYQPEFLCLQNYREHSFVRPDLIDIGLPKDEEIPDGEKWSSAWTRIPTSTSLYNGVATFTRWRWFVLNNYSVDVTGYGNWQRTLSTHSQLLSSGRVDIDPYAQFIIVNVIPPGGSRDLNSPRGVARREFDDNLLHFIVDLRKIHPVIVAGDFKVAAEDRDLHPSLRPFIQPKLTKQEEQALRIKQATQPRFLTDQLVSDPTLSGLYSQHEPYIALRIDHVLRQQFAAYRQAGLYDALRLLTDRDDLYSCWSGHQPRDKAKFSNRELNRGWRSDYFLVDRNIKHLVTNCTILTNVLGSRHAPILLDLGIDSLTVPPPLPDEEQPIYIPPEDSYHDSSDLPDSSADTGGYTSTYAYNPYVP